MREKKSHLCTDVLMMKSAILSNGPKSPNTKSIPAHKWTWKGGSKWGVWVNASLRLQSYLIIHQHFDRFLLSKDDKTSILQLLRHHMPAVAEFFPSLHMYENFLNNERGVLEHSRVLSHLRGGSSNQSSWCAVICYDMRVVREQGEKMMKMNSRRDRCLAFASSSISCQANRVLKNYFVSFNLEPELRTRFQDADFCENIRRSTQTPSREFKIWCEGLPDHHCYEI